MNNGIVPTRLLHPSATDAEVYGMWGASRQRTGIENPIAAAGTAASQGVGSGVLVELGQFNGTLQGETAYSTVTEELPCEMEAVQVCAWNTGVSSNSINVYLHFAVGPPGLERIFLQRVNVGMRNFQGNSVNDFSFCGPYPIRVPAGSRVAVKASRESTSTENTPPILFVNFFKRWPNPGTRAQELPVTSASVSTYGRLVNAGANTKGSYVELGPCPFDAKWAVPSIGFMVDNQINSSQILIDYSYLDQAGTDVVFLGDLNVHNNASENIDIACQVPWPVKVPQGAMVRARYQLGTSIVGQETIAQIVLIGD